MIHRYTVDNESLAKIAKALNYSVTAINTRLKKAGIQMRAQGSALVTPKPKMPPKDTCLLTMVEDALNLQYQYQGLTPGHFVSSLQEIADRRGWKFTFYVSRKR